MSDKEKASFHKQYKQISTCHDGENVEHVFCHWKNMQLEMTDEVKLIDVYVFFLFCYVLVNIWLFVLVSLSTCSVGNLSTFINASIFLLSLTKLLLYQSK